MRALARYGFEFRVLSFELNPRREIALSYSA